MSANIVRITKFSQLKERDLKLDFLKLQFKYLQYINLKQNYIITLNLNTEKIFLK